MHRHRHHLFHATAALVLAACAEDTSTGVVLGAPSASPDLAFVVPSDLRDRLVARSVSTVYDAAGPARTEHLGYGSTSWEDEPIVAYSSIWNAKTRASFLPDRLSVIGSHEYTGNKGSIETVGRVNFAGTQVGSQRAYAENSFPFLVDVAREHFIWTEARVYIDRICGLDGFGDSLHKAWWEAVLGGPVFQFHTSSLTSVSDREYQAACSSSPPPPTSTGFTSTGGQADVVCYVWIVYDLYTGEVYYSQLLYCTDGG